MADTRHSKVDEPLGGLRKGGEQLRAEAHNCLHARCNRGYVKANCSEFLWICKASGLPHVCTMFQCNLFHLSQTKSCVVSGNNFGALECGADEEGSTHVEHR